MSELPRLEGATPEDARLAVAAVGSLSIYGGFLRAALAGIYAERERVTHEHSFRNECHCPAGRCVCLEIPGQVERIAAPRSE